MNINFRKNISAGMMIVALLAIGLIFSILTDGIFFFPRNVAMLMRQTTSVGILAMGMMFVIVAGHIDLSVGSILGFSGTIAAVLQVWFKWPTAAAIALTVCAGAVCGLWHGYWVAYRKVPAFIITLGGLLIFKGAKLGLGKSMSIAPLNPGFSRLGQAYLPTATGWIVGLLAILVTIILIFRGRASRKKYNFQTPPLWRDVVKILLLSVLVLLAVGYLNRYQGIPVPVLIMLFIASVLTFVAHKTVFGRNIYSIGGNIEASALSGIKTRFTTLIVFVVSSGLASIAGIILTARLGASTPAAGDSMELDAIASCVIGGTSMSGGVGKIPGVIIGALIMASLDNGMSLVNMENYWQFIVKGLVLTLAVWMDSMSKGVSE